jgi:uncharacterized protein YdaU (DUF1376 family)
MNYYLRHLGDYARSTGHLTMLQHGALTLLLDAYYATGKPLTKVDVYRLARATHPRHYAAVEMVLQQFFELTPEGYVNRRAEKEINKIKEKRQKASRSAQRRWDARTIPAQSEGNANAPPIPCERTTKAMLTINPLTINPISERARSPTVSTPVREVPLEQLAPTADRAALEEWRKHRAVIGKPLRPHELIAVGKTLTAIGSPAQQRQVVHTCIANGWMNIRIADRATLPIDNARKTEAERAWADLIESEGATRGPATSKALEALGGWLVVRNRTPMTEPKIRAEFCRLYRENYANVA